MSLDGYEDGQTTDTLDPWNPSYEKQSNERQTFSVDDVAGTVSSKPDADSAGPVGS